MELIEIIKSSLSIFTTTVLVFMAIAYTVYKIKDSSRTKPYLIFNVQKPLIGAMNTETVKTIEGIHLEKNDIITDLNKLPIQERFTIINGNVLVNKTIKQEYKKERLKSENEKNFDIYTISG